MSKQCVTTFTSLLTKLFMLEHKSILVLVVYGSASKIRVIIIAEGKSIKTTIDPPNWLGNR